MKRYAIAGTVVLAILAAAPPTAKGFDLAAELRYKVEHTDSQKMLDSFLRMADEHGIDTTGWRRTVPATARELRQQQADEMAASRGSWRKRNETSLARHGVPIPRSHPEPWRGYAAHLEVMKATGELYPCGPRDALCYTIEVNGGEAIEVGYEACEGTMHVWDSMAGVEGSFDKAQGTYWNDWGYMICD